MRSPPRQESGVAINGIFQLSSKFFQYTTIPHTNEVAKSLVDTVDFYTGTHFFKCGHDPIAHVRVKFVVGAKADDALLPKVVFALEIRVSHLNTKLLGFGRSRNDAPSLFDNTTTGRP